MDTQEQGGAGQTPPEQEPGGGAPSEERSITGDQGEPAPIEQDPAEIGVQGDGSVRQSAPPASAQSGVPNLPENEGVEPPAEEESEAGEPQEQPPAQ